VDLLRKAVAQRSGSLANDDDDDESIYKDIWVKKQELRTTTTNHNYIAVDVKRIASVV
jgi:hypothetical protein